MTYRIKVYGHLDRRWSDWFGSVTLTVEDDAAGPVTTLTGLVDQAALHGILLKIRDLNLVLIAVARLEATDSPAWS
ncbi:MAG: hypothetical protein JXB47_06140 [Anaerolineae bacterium]|nr:hypothetical protein [Anaerolineae bacterium]